MKNLYINTYKAILTVLILSCAMYLDARENDGILIITASQNEIGNIRKQEIVNLFMGGASQFDLDPIVLPPGDNSRVIFNTLVIGLTESRIQSYWAQMRFSGRGKPPRQLGSPDEIFSHLQENKNTIAYVPASTKLPDGIAVVMKVEI